MELGALPMPRLFLTSSKRTSIYKKRKVLKFTKIFTIGYYDKFNLQEHWEVSPFVQLEIKYTQQNILNEPHVKSKNQICEIQLYS